MDKSHLPQCHTCLWINQSDSNLASCTRHILIILDATASVCSNFRNDSIYQFAPQQTNLDSNSLYQWIENPVTGQLELAALASFDYIRSWSIDEQRSMRAKRVQLRQFFKRSKI